MKSKSLVLVVCFLQAQERRTAGSARCRLTVSEIANLMCSMSVHIHISVYASVYLSTDRLS